MVNVPSKKLEYLNHGQGATLEKVKEILAIVDMVGEFLPNEIIIEIEEFGPTYHKLSDFKPDYYMEGDKIDKIECIDNLLYTIELNPSERVVLKTPVGLEYFIVNEEDDETLEKIYDTADKLKDVIDTLRSGKKADSTQEAFLRMHNIIE